MKLELKHIVGYLPYGVKMIVVSESDARKGQNTIINGIYFKHGRLEYNTYSGFYYNHELKLILRPLSDLTKEIEVNGKSFVPLEKLKELYFPTSERDNGGFLIEELVFKDGEFKNYFQDLCYTGDNNWIQHSPIGYQTSIEIYEKLHEWHFDIHGLIEKGLAIHKNTLL